MSRGIINVVDNILWPPERRSQAQLKSAYDILEEGQFSYAVHLSLSLAYELTDDLFYSRRLRLLAERSAYFRAALRSPDFQTWFFPTDQAITGMGSSIGHLLDQSYTNNSNEVNEVLRAHVIPLVLFPSMMDSTKQVVTLSANKWISFRKVPKGDGSFQSRIQAHSS